MNHITLTDSQRRTLLLAENFLLLVLVGAGGLLGNWIATTTAGGQYAVVGALIGGGVTLVFGQTANSLVHEVVSGQILDPLEVVQLLLQNATNQVAQAIVPQPQASVTVTTPPSATGTDGTTIIATAGDVSAPATPAPVAPIADSPVDALHADYSDAGQNTPSAITVSADALPSATPVDAAPSSVVSTSVDAARYVTDDAGHRYQLVPVV